MLINFLDQINTVTKFANYPKKGSFFLFFLRLKCIFAKENLINKRYTNYI